MPRVNHAHGRLQFLEEVFKNYAWDNETSSRFRDFQKTYPNLDYTKMFDTITPLAGDREYKVLVRFWGIGQDQETLEDIGKYFKVSRESIRQIKNKATRKMVHPLRRKPLHENLGKMGFHI